MCCSKVRKVWTHLKNKCTDSVFQSIHRSFETRTEITHDAKIKNVGDEAVPEPCTNLGYKTLLSPAPSSSLDMQRGE